MCVSSGTLGATSKLKHGFQDTAGVAAGSFDQVLLAIGCSNQSAITVLLTRVGRDLDGAIFPFLIVCLSVTNTLPSKTSVSKRRNTFFLAYTVYFKNDQSLVASSEINTSGDWSVRCFCVPAKCISISQAISPLNFILFIYPFAQMI